MKIITKYILTFTIVLLVNINLIGQTLVPLNNGIDKPILASCTHNNDLYVVFKTFDMPLHERFKVGKWNGLYWTYYPEFNAPSIGNIIKSGTNPEYTISSIVYYKGKIYLGGKLKDAILTSKTDHLFKWEGNQWINVKNAISTTNKGINKMIVYKNNVYIAGEFKQASSRLASNIAKFDGIKWEHVGVQNSQHQGVNGEVLDMALHNDELYIVGNFSKVAGHVTNNIAWWTGSKWGGIGSPYSNYCSKIFSYNGGVYAYGYSTANYGDLFKFNGTGWLNYNHILADFPNNNLTDAMDIGEELWMSGTFEKNNKKYALIKFDGKNTNTTKLLSNWEYVNINSLNNKLLLTGKFNNNKSKNITNVAKYNPNAVRISGKLFMDKDDDCHHSLGEELISHQLISYIGPSGKTEYTSTDRNGVYEIYGKAGAYSIELSKKQYYNNTCPRQQLTIPNGVNKNGVDFGRMPIPNKKDLRISLNCLSGRTLTTNKKQVFYIIITNKGTTTEKNIIISADYDYRMSEFKSEPNAFEHLYKTAKWKITELKPGEIKRIKITLFIPPLVDGTALPFNTKIDNYTDLGPIDNQQSITFRAGRGNENKYAWKRVSPEGNFTKELNEFEYLIGYRNASNRTVNRLVITDTLDNGFNILKYQITDYSKRWTDFRVKGRIIMYIYDNIKLPPHSKDKLNSMGFFTYKTYLKSNLPIGTVITNTALIDMEFGNVYKSNTTKNTKTKSTGLNTKEIETLKISPNPVQNTLKIDIKLKNNSFSIVDISGKHIGNYKKNLINVSSLKAGVYFIKFKGHTAKFIKL